MTRQNYSSVRRLGAESLEGRLMMAGNVAASVSGGDLNLTGDAAGNRLEIIQMRLNGVPIPDRFLIRGLQGTTINGQAQWTAVGVNDDFNINLNGGDDVIRLGDGSNNANFTVPDDLDINTGNGRDGVNLDRITVRDDATIRTGADADTVGVRASIGQSAGDDLLIETGAGNDFVFLENALVINDLTINTGTTDNGTDIVYMNFSTIGDDLEIRTGGGTDIVDLFNVSVVDDLTINTGAGTDDVDIEQSSVDELFVNLGSENDTLELTNVVGRRAILNGEAGVDLLFLSNNNFSEQFQQTGF